MFICTTYFSTFKINTFESILLFLLKTFYENCFQYQIKLKSLNINLKYSYNIFFLIRLGFVYDHPDDIDLFTGLLSENPLPEAITGPTLTCIIGQQFKNIR